MHSTYVIGDIHGCSEMLSGLLAKIKPLEQDDTVIFIGDYIDRGPDSKGVVDIILALKQDHRRVVTLMGNHEFMLLGAIKGYGQSAYLSIGGNATLNSYGIPAESIDNLASRLPENHLAFYRDLLPYWENGEYIYVHAGLQPGVHLSQQSPDWLFWSRDEFISSTYDYGKKVIYGHTPYNHPRIDSNKIGIDTGAVYGNRLTCLVLPEIRFITQENLIWKNITN